MSEHEELIGCTSSARVWKKRSQHVDLKCFEPEKDQNYFRDIF